MTGESQSSTDERLLPVDEDTAELITSLRREAGEAPVSADDIARAVLALAGPEADRMRVGLARSYRREVLRMAELRRERDSIVGEYDDAIGRIEKRATDLDESLKALAINRRRNGHGNFFDVAGVGRWSTADSAEQWQIDADTLIAALGAEDLQSFTELPAPVEPERKLRRAELVRHLKELLDDAMGDFNGETAEERAAFRRAAAERIVAMFPGVTFVPKELHANGEKPENIVGRARR